MSPEYALDGVFSVKSDVFSFGVVVLEIIGGKRNTGFFQPEQALSLLGYVSFNECFPTHLTLCIIILLVTVPFFKLITGMAFVERRQGSGFN